MDSKESKSIPSDLCTVAIAKFPGLEELNLIKKVPTADPLNICSASVDDKKPWNHL